MTQWQASLPTNIALIKYMGKIDKQKNLPTNASLSYTLDKLRSTVILTEAAVDGFVADSTFNLKEQERFIKHLRFLKNQFGINKNYQIHSENNFPTGCGIASSASSFAALTACAMKAFNQEQLSMQEIAALSRQGSGSSCRSFFSPWALWQGEKASAIDLPYPDLIHHVVVVSHKKKETSTSDAHQLITTSLLFEGRVERAEKRLALLLDALRNKNWPMIYQLAWQEFWDMHALFETAEKPFGYMNQDSFAVLNYLRQHWQAHGDGPIVTMDAGPNVHLLFRAEQQEAIAKITHDLAQQFSIL